MAPINCFYVETIDLFSFLIVKDEIECEQIRKWNEKNPMCDVQSNIISYWVYNSVFLPLSHFQ